MLSDMNHVRCFAYTKYRFPLVFRGRSFSSGSSAAEDVTDTESTTEANSVIEFNKIISLDKSGLLTQHRNILHEERPYKHSCSWIHQTEKYQKKVFGRYGSKCQIDPRICFPQLSAAKSQAACHRIYEPRGIMFMLRKLQVEKEEMDKLKLRREEEICKSMAKLELWTQELHNRNKKKEADALAVKQKKDKLIEEVRRHFGYKVDPRDERFKEVLEQKDKEERRKEKEAKRKAKENKMLTKLTGSGVDI